MGGVLQFWFRDLWVGVRVFFSLFSGWGFGPSFVLLLVLSLGSSVYDFGVLPFRLGLRFLVPSAFSPADPCEGRL